MSQFLLIDNDFSPNADQSVRAALRSALREAGGRMDSTTAKAFNAAVDARLDADLKNIRMDAPGAAGGSVAAGALRHVYSEVLTEEHPVPNGLRIFPTDSSVPLGAKTHEVWRLFERGSARVWRGANSEIPTVNMAQASEQFNIRYYVTKILWDVFEEMADGLANIDRLRMLAEIARDVIESFANQKIWFGDDNNGIYGVLNYPYVTRMALNGPDGQSFSLDEDLASTDTKEYVKELVRFVTTAPIESRQTFRFDRLAMSEKLLTFLKGTLVSDGTSLLPVNLLDLFLKSQSVITSESQIEAVWELDNAFGAGVSGIVGYRSDRNTIANVIPGGSILTFPVTQDGFAKYQPMAMAHGGIVMRQIGNVGIAMVQTTP
jgi:hypothetical protein